MNHMVKKIQNHLFFLVIRKEIPNFTAHGEISPHTQGRAHETRHASI